jgi:hypothetical protein
VPVDCKQNDTAAMMSFNASKWMRTTIYSLLVVALLGALMRYKIAFEFPFFNQKNLQHGHSHFAFSGWISQMLIIFLVHLIRQSTKRLYQYHRILILNLALAYGMLISFTIQGYRSVSIVLSTTSILLSFYFAYCYWKDLRHNNTIIQKFWFAIALACNILSSIGTLILAWMMANKSFDQHTYLASLYWYLHFQYNGWFFFSCMGLFVQYFHQLTGISISKKVGWLLGASVLPAYGLSTLWLPLPWWIYLIIVLASITQFAGWMLFLKQTVSARFYAGLSPLARWLLVYLVIACTLKICLQLGSVIPAVSKFAFGFRPVVIAYLHLALLAITTIFLLTYSLLKEFIPFDRPIRRGIILFAVGVLLNEAVLGIQGIASISYTVIPYANETLFAIAIWMLLGLLMLVSGLRKSVPESTLV